MEKTIIYFILFIFLISIVYAATENYKFLYNPFTTKRDRTVSFNQTDKNWTFANVTADFYFGDGSLLTGIITSINGTDVNLTNLLVIGNILLMVSSIISQITDTLY